MAGSALSRRLSEFVGVALFATALIWLIALVSYHPMDPVWFFNTGADLPPSNFAGRIGAFIAELSLQMLGYAAYLIPVVMVVIGWHYFWCRVLDAAYTKMFGAALLFAWRRVCRWHSSAWTCPAAPSSPAATSERGSRRDSRNT